MFGAALMAWAGKEPVAFARMPFVLAKTLGRVWDSAAKSGLWGLLMTAPEAFRENAARAGFTPKTAECIFTPVGIPRHTVWFLT